MAPGSACFTRFLLHHCALAAGFGVACGGAVMVADLGGVGAMVAAEREPWLVLAMLIGPALIMAPLGAVTCVCEMAGEEH